MKQPLIKNNKEDLNTQLNSVRQTKTAQRFKNEPRFGSENVFIEEK